MEKQETKRMLDLKEVSFTDLDGKEVKIGFDQKDFANALFANAKSIDMDNFARELHKNGQAEINEVIEQELLAIVATLYKHRVVQAIKATISKL